jgi:YD repeat-containing protein
MSYCAKPTRWATRYEYDERGNCLSTIAPDQAQEQRTYNSHDRLVALTDAVGGQWQWVYDEAGNLARRTDPGGRTRAYAYGKGRLEQVSDAARRTTAFAYDAAGNLVEAVAADGQKSRWLYDGWGRVRKSADARGNVQWREHDLLGRVMTVHEPDGNVRRFAYDALDNVVRAQDRHHDVQYAYRGLRRLIRRAEAGTAVEFLHDTEQQLRAVVNEHGLTYRYELDAEGEVITESGFDGLTRRYARDISGQVTEMMLPTGQRTRYDYDPAGRTIRVMYGDGSTEMYAYRADGILMAATNDTSSVQFVRNVLGNTLQENQSAHTVTSIYDAQGQRVSLNSSLGADVHYQRDAAGYIAQIKAGAWQALFERDAQGLEVQRMLSGGVRVRSRRDGLGRLSEQHISIGASQTERNRVYGWQANDRLTQIQDSQHGLTQFTHDAAGSLTATSFGDGIQELRLSDSVGNLFTREDKQDRRYGPAGQLLEACGTRYEYDILGCLTSKTNSQGQQWHYT